MNTAADGLQTKVQIKLTTRHADIELPEDPGVLLVSTSVRRYGLSSLVNSLLQTPKPTPFEFLINGQFLRTSIDDFLTANGISAESTLTIEYTRALIPPKHVASLEHDDWVSAVDVLSRTSPAAWGDNNHVASGQERILSASYDGLLRVWNMSGDLLATSTQPNNGGRVTSLKTAKFLSPTQLVAGGLDMTLRLYTYTEDSFPSSSSQGSITPTLELYSHKSSIESLAFHPSTPTRLLTASSDTTIAIWTTNPSLAPPAPPALLPSSTAISNKRLKSSKQSSDTLPRRGPLALLTAHTAPVTSIIYSPSDSTIAYSASQDHTLRTWDLPTAGLVDTRTTGHSIHSLAALPALHLIAAGTSARHITLIDPRVSATKVAVMTLRGHSNAVVSLATDPWSEYGLVSGSHDGTCRIWDVRSVRTAQVAGGGGQVGESVYSIERESVAKGAKRVVGGEGVKVFGVCWDGEVGIVSCGEDKRVQVNRGNVGGGAES
ncbi:microtubule-associated protein YTM1 [Lepidopterella palustris CBS 459.81]|uniref:Ribosome biogenesis protein YTM1 n=1 Tax=Lepidopterella palustris CBS 459.81 TaxID=1314670 RepID=A0A8E2E290_9PEZI|nr:microtubule-associated protein YTM1 [Lepidopterella palustris CBS 459.81]